MKSFNTSILIFILIGLVSFSAQAQRKKKEKLNLTNAVIIGMIDNQDDRYSIEINMTELFTSRGVKAIPSLNLIKLGADSRTLASDSMANVIKEKGFDTYVLISVRGYDKRFKLSENQPDFEEALNAGTLYELYQPDIVSVSLEFKFYREGKYVTSYMVKCGNIGSRDSVIKRFRKKVGKLIDKKWKK